MEIKIEDVVWRKDLYPRITPNSEKIQTYAENIDVLPPIDINQQNILIDGYHRWRGHETAGAKTINANVIETESEEQLLMLAIKKNSTHGLQLSPDDKKKYAIQWWSRFPDAEICETLSIGKSTFFKWTNNKREQQEKEIKQEMFNRWMQCENQQSIADATGVPIQTVNDKIAKLSEKSSDGESGNFRNFEPEIYNIWNFGKSTNKVKHFGNIPPEILDNLLYYYTKPFDVVFDPFGGGGMTIDVCKQRNRRYYVSDLTPIPARVTEIRQHDITLGLPDDLPVPDFVFLDPPYWKQAEKKYSEKETDISNVDLDSFLNTVGDIAKNTKRKWGKNHTDSKLAIIIGPLKQDGKYIDLPFLCYEKISKYLNLNIRIQCPYSTQVHGGAFVQMAKDKKEVLYLTRDLMVFSK